MTDELHCARPGCGLPWSLHVRGGRGGGTGLGCPHFLWVDPHRDTLPQRAPR